MRQRPTPARGPDRRWLALAATLALAGAAPAADPPDVKRSVAPFLETHCAACHDADTEEGGFRVDTLGTAFADRAEAARWGRVFDQVASGAMPPKRKPRPAPAEASALLDWVGAGLRAEAATRYRAEGRAGRRRLNRVEYENSLRDLLGADVRVAALLPEDGRAHGFDTVDEGLSLSAVQMEKYLEAADRALDAALGGAPPRPFRKQRFTYLTPEKSVALERDRLERGHKLADSVVMVVSNGDKHPWGVREFGAPEPGRYRVRVSASAHQSQGRPVTMRLYDGYFLPGGTKRVTGYFEVPAGEPTVTEAEAYLESPRDTFQVVPYGLTGGPVKGGVAPDHAGPGLRVYWVEIEGPLEAKHWPPASRAELLGGVDPAKGTEADAHAVLRRFAARAFRRPVAEAELAPYLAFASAQLRGGGAFEPAVRAGLKAVLVSPRFLMLDAAPGRLDGHALASRLSYFLWSTAPDAELLAAAAAGHLADPAKRRAQVERILNHPKARSFTANFTDQWLDLRQIDSTTPDKQLYPEFDEWLQLSMVRETRGFFDELLKNDLSVLSVIDSDWAVLNERLAKHYGLTGAGGKPLATGLGLKRVKLPAGSHRGGVLTQASVLKVTANGTTTSPVLRGAFLLDRVLGTPVPPPPANVPAVEPDIRGATTIRAQLAQHRSLGACASCHAKMDPVGFALENYDVTGRWRDRYRVVAGEPGEKPPKGQPGFKLGPAVDAGDTLSTGESFRTVEEFKRLVLARPEPIVRGLAEKLLVYSTGHGLEFADRDAVTAVVAAAKAKNYGLRSLVHAVVESDLFLSK